MLSKFAQFVGLARPFLPVAALTVLRDTGKECFAIEARAKGDACDLRVIADTGAVVAETRTRAALGRVSLTLSDLGLGRRKRGGLRVASILLGQERIHAINLDLRSRGLAGI